jgi:hypothetical protein
LDAELPSALVQFVGAHLELKNALDTAKEQMAVAAKAAKAEARSKVVLKTAPAQTAPARAETKKPADAAAEPAEPRKQEPTRNASLFDIESAIAEPSPASDADEEEEILAEAAEDESGDEADDMYEAA